VKSLVKEELVVRRRRRRRRRTRHLNRTRCSGRVDVHGSLLCVRAVSCDTSTRSMKS